MDDLTRSLVRGWERLARKWGSKKSIAIATAEIAAAAKYLEKAVGPDAASKILIEAVPALAPPTKPRIHSSRADERAILHAVYELGLIKEGDIL